MGYRFCVEGRFHILEIMHVHSVCWEGGREGGGVSPTPAFEYRSLTTQRAFALHSHCQFMLL